jgi:hypothetical protein
MASSFWACPAGAATPSFSRFPDYHLPDRQGDWMYVLVNEDPLGVLDFEGFFETLDEALEARDQSRREYSNPDICVYELVKTPAEQWTDAGWDDEE